MKIELCDSDIYTIGRGSHCDYQLDQIMFKDVEENMKYDKTSRIHIQISQENGKMVLHDKSENGTYANGVKVEKKYLNTGDKIAVIRADFNIFSFNYCAPC